MSEEIVSPTAPTLLPCPWCGPDGDLQLVDASDPGFGDVDEESIDAVVICETCQLRGPPVSQGCHDPDEDGPLLDSLLAAAAAAWNARWVPAGAAPASPVRGVHPPLRLDLAQRRLTRCQSDSDGDCEWKDCPQLRDDEPTKTGRHCPFDRTEEEEES